MLFYRSMKSFLGRTAIKINHFYTGGYVREEFKLENDVLTKAYYAKLTEDQVYEKFKEIKNKEHWNKLLLSEKMQISKQYSKLIDKQEIEISNLINNRKSLKRGSEEYLIVGESLEDLNRDKNNRKDVFCAGDDSVKTELIRNIMNDYSNKTYKYELKETLSSKSTSDAIEMALKIQKLNERRKVNHKGPLNLYDLPDKIKQAERKLAKYNNSYEKFYKYYTTLDEQISKGEDAYKKANKEIEGTSNFRKSAGEVSGKMSFGLAFNIISSEVKRVAFNLTRPIVNPFINDKKRAEYERKYDVFNEKDIESKRKEKDELGARLDRLNKKIKEKEVRLELVREVNDKVYSEVNLGFIDHIKDGWTKVSQGRLLLEAPAFKSKTTHQEKGNLSEKSERLRVDMPIKLIKSAQIQRQNAPVFGKQMTR